MWLYKYAWEKGKRKREDKEKKRGGREREGGKEAVSGEPETVKMVC